MEDNLTRIETPDGVFWTRPNDFVTKQFREQGGHQRSDQCLLISLVRAGDIVLDIGAHIGTFAIPLARAVGNAGHVYAFEPVDDSLRILIRNIEENDLTARATAVHALVGAGEENYSPQIAVDHTSAAYFERTASKDNGNLIAATRLDTWGGEPGIGLKRLDTIKIDTEGMELSVLRSGRDLIENFRPILMIEVTGGHLNRQGDTVGALERFLRNFGYHFFCNLASRGQKTQNFELSRIFSLAHPAGLYDLFAIHPGDERYPIHAASAWPMLFSWIGRRAVHAPAGLMRRLRRR
jgi:FkbM family methyltransferase